ncbi:NAD dependent deacetylase [Strigomonas culicis]|uniref:NAD-dependent protein deacylase n=1 Tax=Strigomonas culicis TaxID=28005 RepID=S9UGB4_9TRYP|nr:NAD dependent deacetylase [Strigomonas culicis]|eukprot:EPY27968.1 NAD dependent deacetylase [Strigomonas culicis]
MGPPNGRLLAQFIRSVGKRNVVVLTGAGCSTESGIPDYRGPHGKYRRPDFVPLTFQAFNSNDYQKKRYWARSMLGYRTMSGASCNATHMGLCALERAGVVQHILTQNVDGLHHLATHGGVGEAGLAASPKYTTSDARLIELHGNIHLVICMLCKHILSREHLQQELIAHNKELYAHYQADESRMQPDGDYVAPPDVVEAMRLVYCPCCGGHLKPHVVLFGENVPTATVTVSMDLVRQSSCLLCLGTSLQVYSAYRYVLAAKEKGVPVVIVNSGRTRAEWGGVAED